MADIQQDLLPWSPPEALLAALARIPKGTLGDYREALVPLVKHDDDDVREQAVRHLFVHLCDDERHEDVVRLLRADRSRNVRRAAAYGVMASSTVTTRAKDTTLLASVALDESEEELVRSAAYDSLLFLCGRADGVQHAKPLSLNEYMDYNWVRTKL